MEDRKLSKISDKAKISILLISIQIFIGVSNRVQAKKKRKKSHSNGKQKSKIIFNSLYRKSQGIHYKTVRTEEGYQDSQIKINIFKNHLYLYTLARNNPKFKLRK